MTARPRISVLLPLQDQRHAGLDCVRAWTSGQAAPDHLHEVVALAPGEDPGLEAAVRPLLRPGDSWIDQSGASEYELYQRGARAARGDYLFITEAHCVPEPDCLQAMLEELERTGAAGVRGESVGEARGELGRLERDTFEVALAPEKEPDHWRKVLIHSLAIRRDLFLAAGGLPPRYGDFSPWVLALALNARGERLAYSPRPAVRHVYDGDLDHLGAHVRDWSRGRLLFCAETPRAHWHPHVQALPEWQERLALSRRGALAAARAALALRHRGAVAPALRHLAVALGGPLGVAQVARTRAAAEALRARRARAAPARREAFVGFWRSTARRGALEGLAQAAPPPEARDGSGIIDLTRDVSGWTIGLRHVESAAGVRYRWTDSLALLRLDVPGETRRARLELHPARPGERPARPAVAVDGRRVATSASAMSIEFDLEGGGLRTVALAFDPYRPARDGLPDRRRLGVAVRSLSLC